MIMSVSHKIRLEWQQELYAIGRSPPLFSPEFVGEATVMARKFIGDTLSLKKNLLDGDGYIIFSGLPQDEDIPSPPTQGECITGKTSISESVLLGVTEALGFHPFSYREEKQGVLIHDITPVTGKETSVSSNGTRDFPWHTDAAFLNRSIRPSTLSLYCLINQTNTGTSLAPVSEILRHLSQMEIDILMDDQFQHHSPETFSVVNDSTRASVIDKVDGQYELKLSSHTIEALTPESKNALISLIEAMNKVAITHLWHPGDMVIFNNLRCVHARGNIHGRRWLKRCYGSLTARAGEVLQLETGPA